MRGNMPLKAITLLKFLFGNSAAIREIATNKSSFWLGLVFVFSAGFAREYDGEDLLHEPWYLLIPLVASVGSSLLLYFLIRIVARNRGDEKLPIHAGYRSFLSIYWITAPLAWLYAIPYEKFLSASDSVYANLTTLEIVAIWRVLLIVRVVSVLYQCRFFSAFFVVMFFADGLAMAILYYTPLPIFNIMGGIHLSASEKIILNEAFLVGFLGWITLPVWIIGTLVIIGVRIKDDDTQPPPWRLQFRTSEEKGIHIALKMIAVLSLLIWIPVLLKTQPVQQNRFQAEKLLHAGKIEEGLNYLSARKQNDFPTYWVPPPRIGYRNPSPSIEKVFIQLLKNNSDDWVYHIYLQNILSHTSEHSDYYFTFMKLERISIEELELFVTWLENESAYSPHMERIFSSEMEQYLDKHKEESKKSSRYELYERIQSLLKEED
jgi:hypothetical protein